MTAPLAVPATREALFRRRRWVAPLLLLADVFSLELSLAAGVALRLALSPWFAIALAPPQVLGIALGLLIIPAGYGFMGLYPGYGLTPAERLRRRVRASVFVFLGLSAWGYLVHREQWSRGVLLATLLFALVLSPLAERALIRLLTSLRLWGTPAVIFGTRESGRAVSRRLHRHPSLGYVPVLAVEIEPEQCFSGAALAAVADLYLRNAGGEPARVAIVALSALEPARRQSLLETLAFRCVIVMAEIADIQTQSITTIDIGGTLGLALNRNLLVPWNRGLKRAFDIAASSLLLVAAAPLLALCAAAIRRSSRGPVLYAQDRVGLDGRTIRIWKLRTMHQDADRLLGQALAGDAELDRQWRQHFKLRDDPRVLPGIGRWLRRSSIDELPQLWNVLRGEMSLVGPRPFPRYHLERFDPEFLRLRACVRPGLTGLWQVSARGEADLSAQQALDTYYIRNWSLWLDIEIAIRTLRAVLYGRGAY